MENGKNVWFIHEPGVSEKMDMILLDQVKDQVLGPKLKEKGPRPNKGICISFCKIAPTDIVIFGAKQLGKKRAPKMIVFHECKEQTIERVLKIIKRFHKEEFQILIKEGAKNKIKDGIGLKVEDYKYIPLYLTAV